MRYLNQCQTEIHEARSRASYTVNLEPSKALQGPAAECDINNIVKMYGPHTMPVPPEVADPRYYGDLSDVPDLQTALDRIKTAQEHFMALPANLRRLFDNDAATLYAFVQDPRNADKCVEMGLLARTTPVPLTPEQRKPPETVEIPSAPII